MAAQSAPPPLRRARTGRTIDRRGIGRNGYALLMAVLVNVGLVLRFGYQFGMGQGRHLFPVLFPISLALAWGLRPLPIKHPTVQAAGFWVTYAVIFTAYSLARFPLRSPPDLFSGLAL